VNPVRVVRRAGADGMEEDNHVAIYADIHLYVSDPGEEIGQFVQLVVMGGEEGPRTDRGMQILGQRPGNADPVERTGSPPDLIEEDQAAVGGGVDDVGGLMHFHEERAFARSDVVACADACEDPVHDADRSPLGRYEAADLGQQYDESGHPQVTRLPAHVRSGNDQDLVVGGVDMHVVRSVLLSGGEELLDNGMSSCGNIKNGGVVDIGFDIPVVHRHTRKRRKAVEQSDGARITLDRFGVQGDARADLSEEGGLQRENPLLGMEDLLLVFFELGGDIPLGVGQRLLPEIGRAHV
jgi:hypothetical protein